MADCLDSVGQSFGDLEVIVVNGSSPDTPKPEKVLQPYLDSIVYIKQLNRHAAGAINTAIGRARGGVSGIPCREDSWLPDRN